MKNSISTISQSYHIESLDFNSLKSLPGFIYIKSLESIYLWSNLYLSKVAIGIESEKAIIGSTDLDFHWKLYGVKMRENDQHVIQTRQSMHITETCQRADGIIYRLYTYKIPLFKNNRLFGLFGISYQQPMSHFHSSLSAREQSCIALMAQGLTDKEIAKKLGISPRTVETYFNSSKMKLNVHSRAELIVLFCGK